MSPKTTPARAIVATGPEENHEPGSNWSIQEVSVPTELADGELLVEMVASGICHTDLLVSSIPVGTPGIAYPRIVGHEGSGYVRAIGPNVSKKVSVGDPVLLSFAHCGDCEGCRTHHPAYCATFTPLNIPCVPDVFRTKDGESGIAGKSFGQSSFASLSVVQEACILPAKDLVRSKEELQLFAPLGCGIQTGAGAVLNLAKPGKDERVMVLGLGGVGLAALMSAKIMECKQILAVDRVESRIDLAKSFGATDGVNTSGVDIEKMAEMFKEATGGLGPTVVIDTTGFLPLIKAGFKSLAPRGTLVFIGANNDPKYVLDIPINEAMMNGSKIIGCVEGDSVPAEFIPELIKHYRDGKLHLEKISKFYQLDEYEKALHDMHSGETIKPILLF